MSPLPPVKLEPGAGDAAQILDRLAMLYPRLIDLSLTRVERLLAALGNPQATLSPVIHVAGTNGKGSTCAFLRAMAEAGGLRANVTTSPHLVRLTERFRLAGRLVGEDTLESVLAEIETVNDGQPITVFEVLAAAGFTLFARTPADLHVVEVGLGGRYDATNVIARPACAAISAISFDHREFLGDTLAKIAWEKAGIMKPGCAAVTAAQDRDVMTVLRDQARAIGVACLWERGQDWDIADHGDHVRYRDRFGSLDLPRPSLAGTHQIGNAGLAVAALRAGGIDLPDAGFHGIAQAQWPARLQRLHGRLAQSLPPGFDLYVDGGHNEGAGLVLADSLKTWAKPLYLLVGMKQSKDATGFLAPLLTLADRTYAICEPGQHLAAPVEQIIAASSWAAIAGPDIAGAFARLRDAPPGRIVICGSLYLAGEVLKADGYLPQ